MSTTTDNTIPQAHDIPRLTVLVHICYTLTGTLYPPPGVPPAGSKPRPAEKPGKPENTYRQQYTSPIGTSGSNPSTEINTNNIRKATDKYTNAMQGIKATTESWEPKDHNNSSTARSDQRKDRQWPRGILSTWELPTHLQYTVPDAKQTQINRTVTSSKTEINRIMRGPKHRKQQLGVTNSTSANPTSLTQQKALSKAQGRNFTYPNKLGAKSDAYANKLHKGDVFARLTSFKQTFKYNIQTKSLSKRSPTLPLLLQSELSTIGNRRR
ncbi:hypothetical protein F511_24621 [Dorcoceras hygrometricum]|uniref:Uncharacterized protein n=1 Tax=Dorcoceras hygrometricum TaxID=472368 RepID=A0A2Z7C0S4_9LAMI|nr:hypothetical protein F511_24621 [Dorcoceras hygrometricum]